MRRDHLMHFAVSGALVAAIAGGLHWHGMKKAPALAIGVSAGLAIGAGKELLYDERPSRGDMTANTLGAVSAVVVLKINIRPKPKKIR